MTAQEMFENLGWKRVDGFVNSIEYERGFRTISFINISEDEHAVTSSGHISMNVLKAINKQVEELGWKQ